jgi:drug/metabolite transporter (DMT)-like permease
VNENRTPHYQNGKGCLILGFTSIIWGLAFVVQTDAAKSIPPLTFNGLRSLIAALFLLVLLLVRRARKRTPILPHEPKSRRTLLVSGVACGLLLAATVNLQQLGLSLYPEGVAAAARGGFLTALYVIFVPLLALLFGKRISLPVLLAVPVAAGGIYLLCLSKGLSHIYLGDVMLLLCALGFSVHILVIDRVRDTVDSVALSMLQFFVCGILSGVIALFAEDFSITALPSVLPALLYMGVLSSGIAYTLQIVGQKYAEPTLASIVMSLESVFAALGGWIFLEDALTPRELIGCVLVFLAILLAQLRLKGRKPEKA